MAKLTERQKANIRAQYAAGGVSFRLLAAKYGVSASTIQSVCSNKEAVQILTQEKTKAKLSMREFFEKRTEKAQSIIDCIFE